MSTKIYSGIKFATNDLLEVHHLMMRWRKKAKKLAVAKQTQFFANLCASYIDRSTMGWKLDEEVEGNIPLSAAWSSFDNRVAKIKKTGYRDPAVDFEFDISILPHDGQLFGMIFCEQNDWVRAFMRDPLVREYRYWNNSDQPSGMSLREWEKRGEVWDQILPGSNPVPAMNGFSASLSSDFYLYPDPKKVTAAIPKLEKRAALIAEDALFQSRHAAKSGAEEPGHREIWSDYLDFRRWLKTEEGQAALASEKEDLMTKLPARITREMLLEKIVSTNEESVAS